VDNYCEEVDRAVRNVVEELGDASEELGVCDGEFQACMLGQGLFDEPSNCFRDYKRCIVRGKRDQKQACQQFLLEWGNDTRRAVRDADEALPLFLNWLHGEEPNPIDDPTRDECLDEAFFISDVCTDQLIDGD
jgi:hypothetical protein